MVLKCMFRIYVVICSIIIGLFKNVWGSKKWFKIRLFRNFNLFFDVSDLR